MSARDELAENLTVDTVTSQFVRHARENPDVVHLCHRCGVGVLGGVLDGHLTEHLQRDRLAAIPDSWEAL